MQSVIAQPFSDRSRYDHSGRGSGWATQGIFRVVLKPLHCYLGCVPLAYKPSAKSGLVSTLEQVIIKALCTWLHSFFPWSHIPQHVDVYQRWYWPDDEQCPVSLREDTLHLGQRVHSLWPGGAVPGNLAGQLGLIRLSLYQWVEKLHSTPKTKSTLSKNSPIPQYCVRELKLNLFPFWNKGVMWQNVEQVLWILSRCTGYIIYLFGIWNNSFVVFILEDVRVPLSYNKTL